MNERTLLILAAVGASAVAYAVYSLMTRPVDPGASDPVAVSASSGPLPTPVPVHPEESPRPPSKPLRLPQARPSPSTPPAGGPPPEVPMPDITLEEARADYDALVSELERELERNEETGKPLANEHWVEYYARSHEVMNPLRRYLSFGTAADKKEVGELDETLRNLLNDLQRDPETLEAPR